MMAIIIIMSVAGVLPVELLENILVRLEVKALISLTIICKSWFDFIYSPSFIKTHLSLNPKNHHLLLCKLGGVTITLCPLNFPGVLPPRSTLPIPISDVHLRNRLKNPPQFRFRGGRRREGGGSFKRTTPLIRLVGSVNGLVCVFIASVDGANIIIWNPATHRFKDILVPDLTVQSFHQNINVSFGYDCLVSDYKVVIFYSFEDEGVMMKNKYRFLIYSCNDNVWKELNTDFIMVHFSSLEGCVIVKGNVYFMGYNEAEGGDVWVSVDVGTEAICVFPGLKYSRNRACFEHDSITFLTCIKDFGDSAAYVVYSFASSNETIDVYALEESSCVWTKVYTIDSIDRLTALCLQCPKTDKFVLRNPHGRLFVYEFVSKKFKDLGIDPEGGRAYYMDFNYTESLVAIDGMRSIREEGAEEAAVSSSDRYSVESNSMCGFWG